MEWETLSFERQGAVARVWLNRPERRNALNTRALEEIVELFTGLQTDFEIRVVVLGGRGPSFCAGADRRDPPGVAGAPGAPEAGPRERRWVSQLGRRALESIEALESVSIARLHGHVIGGGLVLALGCDLRVAAEGTRLSLPEVDLGVPLTWGGTPRLIQEIGTARAREMLLLGDPIDARQALAWGLVQRVTSTEELDSCVDELATRISRKPEVAVHMTKTQLRGYAARDDLGDLTQADGDLLLAAGSMPAARESFQRK